MFGKANDPQNSAENKSNFKNRIENLYPEDFIWQWPKDGIIKYTKQNKKNACTQIQESFLLQSVPDIFLIAKYITNNENQKWESEIEPVGNEVMGCGPLIS